MKQTLYYKNNYLSEFTAKVIDCIEENGKYKVVLDDTAFYPEGGGQNADTGWLDEVRVFDVQEKNGIIYHYVNEKIEVGKEVNGKIDFEERFQSMQHHTAEHIVSGLICKKYKAENVGFHMGKDAVTMDFNVELNKEQIEEIEILANEAVYKNLPIKVTYLESKEAERIEYRSKKKIDGIIRIVEIPGYDICACCGVHVSNTGEIGTIKLLSVKKYKSGCRVSLLCGKRALLNYNEIYKYVDDTTTLLSVKHYELEEAVKELIEKNKELKHINSILKANKFESSLKDRKVEKVQIVIDEKLEPQEMKIFCNNLLEKAEDIAGIFSKENDVYRFQIMSKQSNLKDYVKDLVQKYNGKGGGSSNYIQGQVKCNKEELDQIIQNLHNM